MYKIIFFIVLFVAISFKGFSSHFLKICDNNNIKFEFRINQYDAERDNIILSRQSSPLKDENSSIDFLNSKWNVSPVFIKEDDNQYSVEVIFECLEGGLDNASLSVDLIADQWSANNYVLFPGAVYNGNRYPSVKTDYPPFVTEFRQIGPKKPLMISDQPRLNYTEGYSRIQERSGSLSLPAVGYHSPSQKKGMFMWFPQNSSLGDYGVDIEETSDRSKAYISLTAPVVRERYQYKSCNTRAKTTDKPVNFSKGDKVKIEFKIVLFASKNIQTLFNQFTLVQRTYIQETDITPLMPLSETYEGVKDKYNRVNWIESGYYATQTMNDMFQTAWIGGVITLLPLLKAGDGLTQERVYSNLEWFFKRCNTGSNYLPDRITKGKPATVLDYKPIGQIYPLVLTRRNAEAAYYLFLLFDELKKMDKEVPAQWEDKTLAAVDAQYDTWHKYDDLGQFVNIETGEIVVGNSSSAGIFPATLCKAYELTNKPSYIEKAKEIAEYYYNNFIVKGITCGGPGDALHSIDSESSYSLLVGLIELYKTTGEKVWLDRAIEMANQFASWVVAYNFEFPEGSLYYNLKMQTGGTVIANTQNKHTAPGICTHSGIALLDLYRFTGDKYYLKLIALMSKTLPQYLSTKDRPIKCLEEGWVSERINMTDWAEPIGETMCQSNWSEVALLLTYDELPGVYINYDENWIVSLDHVEARIIKNSKKILVLELYNPTNYDAVVKVLAENGKQSLSSFAEVSGLMKSIKIEANSKVTFKMPK